MKGDGRGGKAECCKAWVFLHLYFPPSALPATKVARTVYHGPYEGLRVAWGEFETWIAANGHTPALNLWECYVVGPESNPDPATFRMEFNRPVIR